MPDLLTSLPRPVQRSAQNTNNNHHRSSAKDTNSKSEIKCYSQPHVAAEHSVVRNKSSLQDHSDRINNKQSGQHYQSKSNTDCTEAKNHTGIQKSKSAMDYSVKNLTGLMKRTSLSLQSDDNSSSLTQVTKLDNLLDTSIVTLDETFFERHRPIRKSVFHDSDISTISTDTIQSDSVTASLNEAFEFCADETATNEGKQNISEDGSATNLPKRKGNKCLPASTVGQQGNISRRDKENTPSPEIHVDELWNEVRACNHARRQFKDKTNILDTAFCGRQSVCSLYSDASTVDYVYTDKENGITLIERHVPSLCGSAGSRRSLDSTRSGVSQQSSPGSQNTDSSQDTVLYDWKGNKVDNSDTNSVIRMKLCNIGDDPGPVTKTTRQTYLRRLSQLQNDPEKKLLTKKTPGKE